MKSTSVDERGRTYFMVDKQCPICGPSAQRFIGWRGGKYQRYRKGCVTRIVRCQACGLLFPNPFPVPVQPQEIYGDPDKYFAHRDFEEGVERRRFLIREIQRRTGNPQPRVLDVGSGRGETIEAAKREGIEDVVGLELSEAMARACSERTGASVLLESIEQHATSSAGTYDTVLLLAVLEHVFDPDSMIASAGRLLVPHGILFIDCPVEPNLLTTVSNAVNRLMFSRGVYNLSPTFEPFHVFGFNPGSLRRSLSKHGMNVEEIVFADEPRIGSDGTAKDRMRAYLGRQLNRMARLANRASNMGVWAKRNG